MRVGTQCHPLAVEFREREMTRSSGEIDVNILTDTHTAMRTSLMVDGQSYTELILVRHAQQLFTPEARREGGALGPHLSQQGHQQAQLVAHYLSNQSVAAIYSSHLHRARQTAQVIADCNETRLQVQVRQDLREVERLRPVTEGSWPEATLSRGVEFFETRSFDSIPGLEPSAAARERLTRQLATIAAEHPQQRVAVVAHGGAISIFLAELLGSTQDMFFFAAHASVTRVFFDDGRWALHSINETSHLQDHGLVTF